MRLLQFQRKRRGILLFTALIIAVIMMLWAVAATCRANYQTNITLLGFRKSEVYYLAKRGISRGLYKLNSDPAWSPSPTTPDLSLVTLATSGPTSGLPPEGKCAIWLDTAGTPPVQALICKATIGTQTQVLTVSLQKTTGPTAPKIYSVTPTPSGPDAIAWLDTFATMANNPPWKALPPIPGVQNIIATAQTSNGDLYAIGQTTPTLPPGPPQHQLWRYRSGGGWIQMPSLPTGVTVSSISAGGTGIVCQASNQLMVLPLGTNTAQEYKWYSVPGPAGITMNSVAANPNDGAATGAGMVYAAGTDSTGKVVVNQANINGLYDTSTTTFPAGIATTTLTSGTVPAWTTLPDIGAVTIDPKTGTTLTAAPPNVPNLSGGIVVDNHGALFAVANSPVPTSCAVIYTCQPNTVPPVWQYLKPDPAFDFNGVGTYWGTIGTTPVYLSPRPNNLTNLQADNQGNLYVQWAEPASTKFSTLSFKSSPAIPCP